MPRPEDIQRARRLLRRYRHRLTPAEARTLEHLLNRIAAGRAGRSEALRIVAGLLRRRGLTVEQARRRLRLTPYYGLVMRLARDL
ncbi:MAG: hypothetical protein FWJ62_02770 [Thermaerobacter sp.]|nr:hypothetical protein [Bacillota bacterium]REJ36879.1 MAG: hypothetical protein DIU84_05265 [Bacillota bacterium]